MGPGVRQWLHAGLRGGGSSLRVKLTPRMRGKIERSADASKGRHNPCLSPNMVRANDTGALWLHRSVTTLGRQNPSCPGACALQQPKNCIFTRDTVGEFVGAGTSSGDRLLRWSCRSAGVAPALDVGNREGCPTVGEFVGAGLAPALDVGNSIRGEDKAVAGDEVVA